MTDPAPLSSRSVEELRDLILRAICWLSSQEITGVEPLIDELCARITRRDAEIAELRKAAGVNGDRASYLFNHSQGYAT